MQQGASSDRVLEVAPGTHENPSLHPELLGHVATALPALVATWPSQRSQVLNAGLLGGEALLEAVQGSHRVFLSHETPLEILSASN